MRRRKSRKRPFAERDAQILALYNSGTTVALLALRYGIHKSRAYKIITRETLRSER